MLLVEATLNSELHRISIQGHPLAHNWKARIISMDHITWGCRSNRGGFCPLGYGKIVFKPKLFEDNFPPSDTGQIVAKYTPDTEDNAVTLFNATAYASGFPENKPEYTLLPPDYDETLAASSLSTGSLTSVLTTILTGIAEISSVDTTLARNPSPEVVPDNYEGRLNIDYADDLSKSFCHLVYIIGTTAHVIDMKAGNGDEIVLTDSKVTNNIRIFRNMPIAEIQHDDGTNVYTRQSDYPMGKKLNLRIPHTSQANIEAALDDIMLVENKWRGSATIKLSSLGGIILPRQKITWTDYYLHPIDRKAVRISIYPIDIRFDFNLGSGWVTVSGDLEMVVP